MNLESFGFPVDKYAERISTEVSAVKGPIVGEHDTSIDSENPSSVKIEEIPEASIEPPTVQAVEKKARAPSDPLESLSGQVPQPNASGSRTSQLTLDACALLTRDFNAVMGLPMGELPQCVHKDRGSAYGRMLREG